ncbi:MAG: hypothetical protein RLZZ602_1243, partial [Pseudomonadota bacterium]
MDVSAVNRSEAHVAIPKGKKTY